MGKECIISTWKTQCTIFKATVAGFRGKVDRNLQQLVFQVFDGLCSRGVLQFSWNQGSFVSDFFWNLLNLKFFSV